MTKIALLFILLMNVCVGSLTAQKNGKKKAIIVLTYDDALNSQLQIAIPQLDSAKITATFFLDGKAQQQNFAAWQQVGRKGYELANHTYYHPCVNAGATSSKNYTIRSMLAEISRMNDVLHKIDGNLVRTYAYPCTETAINGQSYIDSLKQSGLIKYARIGGDSNAIITDYKKLDPLLVPSWAVVGNYTGADLIAFVKKVELNGGLGIFMFHGIGGDYITTSAAAHRELVTYLATHRGKIVVTSFRRAIEMVTVGSAD